MENNQTSEELNKYKQHVAERLAPLQPVLQKAAMGDFSQKIEIPETEDELTALFNAINLMLDNLKKIQTQGEQKRIRIEQTTQDLKKEVREKTKKVRETERLRERFMMDASHELRTPLAVLQANVEMLSSLEDSKKRLSREDRGRYLESSKNQIQNLTSVLDELSLLGRGKRLEELREQIKLENLVQETAEELKPLADAKKQDYKINLDQGVEISGDGVMLKKLTRNLISNAIKYGREGGKIGITLKKQSGEAELTVEDDGGGIPKKDLPFVLERFYRVDKGRSKERGGVGLGLAICKWVAELHGGRIEVESAYRKGSKFKTYLPLRGSWGDRTGFWDYRIRKLGKGALK